MKLDKMTFSRVIAHCVSNGMSPGNYEIDYLDDLINFEVLDHQICYPSTDDINGLLECMVGGTRKLDAIRYHRKLTGWSLKESKDFIEKYWIAKPINPAD